ncbi:hypothetical protein [Streptomyces minutiscleroticus]|uniref:hypothetical protein n=1 Tax=Streptomyces minutiscleroticus TaxID=68238 RepID=UPI00331F782C
MPTSMPRVEEPHATGSRVLVISDRLDDAPVRLQPCTVPLRHTPSAHFTTAEYQAAPLVILDDRSYTAFTLRHMPHRQGLILVLAAPDDASVYPRAAAIGAEAVIPIDRSMDRLHLRLHDATDCRHTDWNAPFNTGPANGPTPGDDA